MIQNGITVTDDGPGGNATDAEMLQLTNLLKVQSKILKLGFTEKFSQALHLDGTQSVDAITGLDSLVSLTPTTGTVGGIDRAVAGNAFWRNYGTTGLTTTTTTGTILDGMEIAYRAQVRNGGKPDFYEAGDDFIDGFRQHMMKTYGRVDYQGVGIFRDVKAGTEMVSFHGIPIIWSPEYDDLDTLFNPTPTWSKRCYGLNTNFIKLRPIQGQDMMTRKPPRAYDKYEWYWGLTWRGAMTMDRSNAQSVVSIA